MPAHKSIHIGTSGWSYDHWKGPFYPEKTSGEEMLSLYAEHFQTVEVNNTFYQLPSTDTLKNWKETVSDNFLFALKASRYITHQKKLNDPAESIKKFFDRIEVLDDKLGPILFQLPPRWHKNAERLSNFIDVLPKGYRYVFEFRDPTWFSDDIIELLSETNCAFCIYDLEGEQTPEHVTTDFVYIRLHGPGAAYQGSYSEQLLEKWVEKIDRWSAEGKEIYCYFNNDYAGHAPNNASVLQKLEMRNT